MAQTSEHLNSGIGVFAAVVDARSFSAAAQTLGISPPGIRRAIARLGTRLKTRLFHRTTRTVVLTEAGRQFHASRGCGKDACSSCSQAVPKLAPPWCDGRFALDAYYPSRHYVPTKTREFLDFVIAMTAGRQLPGAARPVVAK